MCFYLAKVTLAFWGENCVGGWGTEQERGREARAVALATRWGLVLNLKGWRWRDCGLGCGICLYHQNVLIILPPPPSFIYFERKNIASSKTLMFIHCSYTLEWIGHSGIAWFIRWIQNHPPGKFRPAIHSESWNVWFGCFHWHINLIISSSSLSLAWCKPWLRCSEVQWWD